jgi:uncharacterized membrane protein YkoI
MDAVSTRAKMMVVVAAGAVLLLVGAGVAYATGSDGDPSEQAAGTNLDKAKSVALQEVNGQVTGSEVGDEEGAYQIEVTRPDGTQVDVNIDKNFNVINAKADHDNVQAEDGGGDSSDSGNDGG